MDDWPATIIARSMRTDNDNRVLVTGGAGFIGSHLCQRLVASEKEVPCVEDGLRDAIAYFHES